MSVTVGIFGLFCLATMAVVILAGVVSIIVVVSRSLPQWNLSGRQVAAAAGILVVLGLCFGWSSTSVSTLVDTRTALPDSTSFSVGPSTDIGRHDIEMHETYRRPTVWVGSLAPWSALMLMALLILLGGAFGLMRAYHKNGEHSTTELGLSTHSSRVQTAVVSGAILLAIAAAMFGVMRFRHYDLQLEAHVTQQQEGRALDEYRQGTIGYAPMQRVRPQPGAPVDLDAAVSALETSNDPLPQADLTATTEPAPDWLTTGNHVFGDRQMTVVASQQYATEHEARADALAQVALIVAQDTAKYLSPELIRPRDDLVRLEAGATISPEVIHLGIHDTYVQTVQRDFGTFFAPMYRVWHRVELSPMVREPLLLRWHEAVLTARTRTVVAGFAALTLIPLGIVFATSLLKLTAGAFAPLVRSATALGVVALWIVGASVLNQFVVLW